VNDNRDYLILPAAHRVLWTSFQANDGHIRYYAPPEENPGTVMFQPSGVCVPTHIVPGDFGTRLEDEIATALFATLWKVMRKQCRIRGTAAVGQEALALHRAGYRLCDRLAASTECDLVVPED
jgi:hypothetical protein